MTTVWCWKEQTGIWGDNCWAISAVAPKICEEDELWGEHKKGDIITPIRGLVMCYNWREHPQLATLSEILPLGKSVKEFKFHEDLWGYAKDQPGYDKKFWVQMQNDLKLDCRDPDVPPWAAEDKPKRFLPDGCWALILERSDGQRIEVCHLTSRTLISAIAANKVLCAIQDTMDTGGKWEAW